MPPPHPQALWSTSAHFQACFPGRQGFWISVFGQCSYGLPRLVGGHGRNQHRHAPTLAHRGHASWTADTTTTQSSLLKLHAREA